MKSRISGGKCGSVILVSSRVTAIHFGAVRAVPSPVADIMSTRHSGGRCQSHNQRYIYRLKPVSKTSPRRVCIFKKQATDI